MMSNANSQSAQPTRSIQPAQPAYYGPGRNWKTWSMFAALIAGGATIFILLLSPASISGQSKSDQEGKKFIAPEDDTQKLNEEALRKVAKNIDFNGDNVTLESGIKVLRKLMQVNIFVNWHVLEQVGVERKTEITLELTEVSGAKILDFMLEQANTGGFDPLGWSIRDGIVVISTQSDLKRHAVTRLYDIRSFLVVAPDYYGPMLELDAALTNTNSGGSRNGERASPSGGWGGEDEELSREEMIQQITDLIRANVGDPVEWEAMGGEYSSVRELNGQLIIRTGPENHKDVESLLEDLNVTKNKMVSLHAEYYLVDTKALRKALAQGDGGLIMDRKSADAFVAEIEKAGGKRVGSGRTACFNAQRVYITAINEQMFLSDQIPIPDSGTVDPTLSTVLHGMSLEVRPTIETSGKHIVLNVVSDLVTGKTFRTTEIPIFRVPRGPKKKDEKNKSNPEAEKAANDVRDEAKDEARDKAAAALDALAKDKALKAQAANAFEMAIIKIELPGHDQVSHRGTVLIPDGGAVIMTATSSALNGSVEMDMEVVLVLRAKAQIME